MTAAALDVVSRVRLVATVPDLDHLVRSGRVPGIAGWAGRTLGISPLFEFRSGKVRRLRPALGVEAAHDRIVARFRARRLQEHAPTWSPSTRSRRTWPTRCSRAVGETAAVESFTSEFGSVMVVHAGPGLVGLAWWWEPVSPGDPPG